MSQDVLMFSGGLDSYLAYLTLKQNGIHPLLVYADIGHRYRVEEMEAAAALAGRHGEVIHKSNVLNLGMYESLDAFIPNRNGFLAMVGALYGDKIWMAIMEGEQSYDDCKKDTFFAMSLALTNMSGRSTVVDSPFWNYTKAEVIKELKPGYRDSLRATRSCHNMHLHGGLHCGRCGACFRRWVAFSVNNIKENYVHTPYEGPLAEEYKAKVSDDSVYGVRRSVEIREAFRKVGRL